MPHIIAASKKHLIRHWKSVPLPQLKQGATLSIRSHVPVTTVRVEPAWRDNGHADFHQVLLQVPGSNNKTDPLQEQVEMIVSLEKDQMTSLGRTASLVSLLLQPTSPTTAQQQGTESSASSSETTNNHHDVSNKATKKEGSLYDGDATENDIASADNAAAEHISSQEHGHGQEPGIYLTVQIPEKTNLSCDLSHGGSIEIPNGKVEGDVSLCTTNGNIHVKKLRGHRLELKAAADSSSRSRRNHIMDNDDSTGTIVVSDLLEAQKLVMETNGRVRVKQIHAHTADISVDVAASGAAHSPALDPSMLPVDDEGSLIDISSLYLAAGNASNIGGATLSVQGPCQPQRRAVRVKSHHGPLRVETREISKPREQNAMTSQTYPIVELGGVNGNVEVSMEQAQTQQQSSMMQEIDENSKTDESTWSSCCVHVDSLSQDSVSLISVDNGSTGGDVSLTLDRKVEADLRFASTNSAECLEEMGALLAEEEDNDLVVQVLKHLPNSVDTKNDKDGVDGSAIDKKRIDIDTTAFTPLPSPSAGFKSDSIEYMQGWVENNSQEPDSRFERKTRGDGHTSSTGGGDAGSVGKIRITSAAEQALHGFTDSKEEDAESSSSSYLRPLLAVMNTGRIKVETVSWLGAIARRYGLEETERDVGRTAARKGRPFAWRNQ